MDLKLEARNILARGYKEFQQLGQNVVYYNRYRAGRTFAISVSANF